MLLQMCVTSITLQLTTFNKKSIEHESLCRMYRPHGSGCLQLVNQWFGMSTEKLLSGL